MNSSVLSTTQNVHSDLLSTNATAVISRCENGSLTGSFGLIIQFLLALLAMTCLILKRFCEPRDQRRPWLVWFYDTSKQGFGAAAIHFSNIFISKSAKDPCIWYVMNFLLDSTVGLLVIYILLRIVDCTARWFKVIRHGEYGEPPQFSRWVVQCLVYVIIMMAEKLVIIAVMTLDIWIVISEYIMSPIRDADLELVMVMFVIPLVVNAIMFWVVDNFLMKRKLSLPRFRTRVTKYHRVPGEADSGADDDKEGVKLTDVLSDSGSTRARAHCVELE